MTPCRILYTFFVDVPGDPSPTQTIFARARRSSKYIQSSSPVSLQNKRQHIQSRAQEGGKPNTQANWPPTAALGPLENGSKSPLAFPCLATLATHPRRVRFKELLQELNPRWIPGAGSLRDQGWEPVVSPLALDSLYMFYFWGSTNFGLLSRKIVCPKKAKDSTRFVWKPQKKNRHKRLFPKKNLRGPLLFFTLWTFFSRGSFFFILPSYLVQVPETRVQGFPDIDLWIDLWSGRLDLWIEDWPGPVRVRVRVRVRVKVRVRVRVRVKVRVIFSFVNK